MKFTARMVRMWRFIALALVLTGGIVGAQEKIPPRFNIDADVDQFPQKTPQDTLRSVLKAIEAKRVNYLLAHLADPAFVDQRVKDVGGKFEIMVQETTKKFDADPESLRQMRKFLTDGEWKEDGNVASASSKEVRGKSMYFKKIGNRWFLENRKEAGKGEGK
jgi:hypothetical protein